MPITSGISWIAPVAIVLAIRTNSRLSESEIGSWSFGVFFFAERPDHDPAQLALPPAFDRAVDISDPDSGWPVFDSLDLASPISLPSCDQRFARSGGMQYVEQASHGDVDGQIICGPVKEIRQSDSSPDVAIPVKFD
jgi:hypothetical protein